ncbi:hypothetical protein ACWKSP_12665 [Micromonosporaceae bacterium Da 78-11]
MDAREIDILESPERPPPARRSVTAGVVLAVVAAAAAGYVVGARQEKAPTPAPPAAGEITTTGHRCSQQSGAGLQLGVEIANRSATDAVLRQINVDLPLGGLRPKEVSWGSCGQLSPAQGGASFELAAGATTWLAVTFDVLVACPAPLPVRFTVDYEQDGRTATVTVPGFPDLGDVPLAASKCPAD